MVDEAVTGPGIASTPGNEYVVVRSPHQNNFAMPLRVEVWPGEPVDDLDQLRAPDMIPGLGDPAGEPPQVG